MENIFVFFGCCLSLLPTRADAVLIIPRAQSGRKIKSNPYLVREGEEEEEKRESRGENRLEEIMVIFFRNPIA